MEIHFRYAMKGTVSNVLEICGLLKLLKFSSCTLTTALKTTGLTPK